MSKLALILAVLCPAITHCDVITMIRKEAQIQGVDPRLAVAVARVESGLNQKSIGKAGEVGVFQLHPAQFKQKSIGNLETNIRLGVAHLKYWKKYCPVREGFAWVTCYNQGFRHPRFPEKHPYYVKVAREMR